MGHGKDIGLGARVAFTGTVNGKERRLWGKVVGLSHGIFRIEADDVKPDGGTYFYVGPSEASTLSALDEFIDRTFKDE